MTADQQDLAELMKVGVNFPVGAPALESCLAVNRRINEISPGAVVVGPDGTSSPHVTITMGQIQRGRIDALVDRLTELAHDLGGPVGLDFGPAYRERVTGRYVMADVTFVNEVQAWRRDARQHLSGFFVDPARTSARHISPWASPNRPSARSIASSATCPTSRPVWSAFCTCR